MPFLHMPSRMKNIKIYSKNLHYDYCALQESIGHASTNILYIVRTEFAFSKFLRVDVKKLTLIRFCIVEMSMSKFWVSGVAQNLNSLNVPVLMIPIYIHSISDSVLIIDIFNMMLIVGQISQISFTTV